MQRAALLFSAMLSAALTDRVVSLAGLKLALFGVQWRELLVPDVALLEMFLRGTLLYLGIFVILRVFRSPTGQLSVADVLLLAIIGDAPQNAMAREYHSITSGFVLVGTIVFWDRLIDHLSYQWPCFARAAEPPPVVLIEDGVVMRKHKITTDGLLSHLRQHGVEDPARTRLCELESDGKISVVSKQTD